MILDLSEWKKKQLNQKVTAHCREYDVYYEYCLVDNYEDKFGTFHVHSIQLGDVFAGILEERHRYYLVSIQFFKEQYSLTRIVAWIDENALFFEDAAAGSIQIPNCSRVTQGVRFYGRPVVSYELGHQTVDFDVSECVEVNDIYQHYDCIVNTANATDVESVDECKVTVFLNGERAYRVPEMRFDIANGDLIVCNGMVVVADLIEDYCGTVGFTQTDNAMLPVTFFHDDDTPIYIDIKTRADGSKLCVVTQDSPTYVESGFDR